MYIQERKMMKIDIKRKKERETDRQTDSKTEREIKKEKKAYEHFPTGIEPIKVKILIFIF
jgi:hypothetical protein